MSNRLIDFAPDVLRWWYAAATKTGRDSFLMGPSGYGYLYPANIQSADVQQAFAAATAAAADQLGMEGYVHWDLPNPRRVQTFLKLLDGTAVRSVFVDPTAAIGIPDSVGSVGVVKHTSLDAGAISKLPKGGFHFVYQIWDRPLEDLSSLAAGVAEHVELVGYRELIALQRQKAELP